MDSVESSVPYASKAMTVFWSLMLSDAIGVAVRRIGKNTIERLTEIESTRLTDLGGV